MAKLTIFLVIVFVSGLVMGCSAPKEPSDMAAGYFESIKQKDFDKVLTFYSPKFFEKTSQADWLQALNNINKKLGDLQTYKLTNWEITTTVGSEGNGTYYKMQYEVNYSKYSSSETLTLFKPALGGGLKILGYNINSPGFLKE